MGSLGIFIPWLNVSVSRPGPLSGQAAAVPLSLTASPCQRGQLLGEKASPPRWQQVTFGCPIQERRLRGVLQPLDRIAMGTAPISQAAPRRGKPCHTGAATPVLLKITSEGDVTRPGLRCHLGSLNAPQPGQAPGQARGFLRAGIPPPAQPRVTAYRSRVPDRRAVRLFRFQARAKLGSPGLPGEPLSLRSLRAPMRAGAVSTGADPAAVFPRGVRSRSRRGQGKRKPWEPPGGPNH